MALPGETLSPSNFDTGSSLQDTIRSNESQLVIGSALFFLGFLAGSNRLSMLGNVGRDVLSSFGGIFYQAFSDSLRERGVIGSRR